MNTPFKLTHPDKILYAEQGITKLELVNFYEKISDWILPYIINRPLTLLRCPQGWQSKCFYQKHLQDSQSSGSLLTVDIQEKEGIQPYIYLKDKMGLMALAQLDILEIHPWGSKINSVETPDLIIFDLDPAPDVEWKEVVKAAFFIREQLENIRLKSFIKTTGGKGLHIVIPIKPHYEWKEIKEFSHEFVNCLVSLKPKKYIGSASKSKRAGKIFIDYLRNQRGATAIAPYSTRAKENAPVSTPLAWEELSSRIHPNAYTIKNLPKRLERLSEDPWKDFFKNPQSIERFFT